MKKAEEVTSALHHLIFPALPPCERGGRHLQVGSKKQSVVGIVPTPDPDGGDGQGDAKAAVNKLDTAWASDFAVKVRVRVRVRVCLCVCAHKEGFA